MTLVAGVTIVFAGRAYAELGGPLSTVESDGARMRSPVISTKMGIYTLHGLTRGNGATVHELTNDNGQVFAVTWSGPGKPDLRSILGPYFTAFQAANVTAGRTMHSLRRPPQVTTSDLQIRTGGHMGWFHGVAFIPSLAPAGFSASDLPQDR